MQVDIQGGNLCPLWLDWLRSVPPARMHVCLGVPELPPCPGARRIKALHPKCAAHMRNAQCAHAPSGKAVCHHTPVKGDECATVRGVLCMCDATGFVRGCALFKQVICGLCPIALRRVRTSDLPHLGLPQRRQAAVQRRAVQVAHLPGSTATTERSGSTGSTASTNTMKQSLKQVVYGTQKWNKSYHWGAVPLATIPHSTPSCTHNVHTCACTRTAGSTFSRSAGPHALASALSKACTGG